MNNDSELTFPIPAIPENILYPLAIALMKGVSQEIIRRLLEAEVDPAALFTGGLNEVNGMLGLKPEFRLQPHDAEEALLDARKECQFTTPHHIDILTPWSEEYPKRLFQLADFPKVLFRLGKCDLNNPHPLGIVGTRRATNYGLQFTEHLVGELKNIPGLSIISGLALGIDGAAHRGALLSGVPTIAVLAHGLSRLYPPQHRELARQIIQSGGCLLTEYTSAEKPYRQHFLERNRIVAGLSDAVVVAESPVKGGAMSTASIAFSYDRTLLALPGRISDPQSGGCNLLISQQKALIITSAADIVTQLGAEFGSGNPIPVPASLFPEIEGDGKRLYEYLQRKGAPAAVDELCQALRLPINRLLPLVSDLEFDGILSRLPGNRVELS